MSVNYNLSNKKLLAEEGLNLYREYFQANYTQNDINRVIFNAVDSDPAYSAQIQNNIEEQSPLGWLLNTTIPADTYVNFTEAALTAGSAFVYKAGNVIKNVKPIPSAINSYNVSDNITYLLKTGDAVNDNVLPKIVGLSKGLSHAAIGAAFGLAATKIAAEETLTGAAGETSKQAILLGGSIITGHYASAGITAVLIGAGVTGTLPIILTGVVVGVAVGFAYGYLEQNWDSIVGFIDNAINQGASAMQAAAEAMAQFGNSFLNAWDQTGEAARQAVNDALDVGADLLDGMIDAFEDIKDWAQDVIAKIGDAISNSSPLVLDLDGDGIELISVSSADAVYWDIDLDGFAEASGWVGADDGLLAIDLNADGIINDSSELFGNVTGFSNGFMALAEYDSNNDGLITSEDARWDDLIIWQDVNGDGYSQSDELYGLNALGISEINLGYTNTNYQIAGKVSPKAGLSPQILDFNKGGLRFTPSNDNMNIPKIVANDNVKQSEITLTRLVA